ncbi:RDD family protein, partial [Kitasatospora paracochleata]|uniref:RDD family protein n=1 Tax=Kitasatospora paracochleata TaxID=58354 RepID=UPI0031D36C8B
APAAAAGRRGGVAAPVVAGLGRRLVARAVDTAVFAVVAVAAGVPLLGSALAHVQEKVERAQEAARLAGRHTQVWLVDSVTLGKFGALLGVLVLLGVVYEILPTSRTGQTFGKRLARIKVVDAAGSRPPRVGRSVARWLVRQVGVLLVLGLLSPLLDRRTRRAWHDRAARTRVVRA